jgi:hypothetical protein
MTDLATQQGKQAAAWCNEEFILVETYSGHGRMGFDAQGAHHALPPDASDESVGSAILDALSRSRFLTAEEAAPFFELKRIADEYSKSTQSFMTRYGYKTKRRLFAHMKSCGIQLVGNNITIRPTNHERLEGWGRDRDDGIEDIVIAAASHVSEVGAALRLAFARCK